MKHKTTLASPISNYPQKLICTELKGLKLSLENLQTLDLILALDTHSLENIYLRVTFWSFWSACSKTHQRQQSSLLSESSD